MRQPFLIGTKLYLRVLDASDLDGPYLDWLNDQDTTRFLETGRFPTTRKSLEEAIQPSARQTDSLLLAIVDRKTDQHIGNIKLGPLNWVHRYGSIGILIGNPAYRGRSYGRQAVELVLEHAFCQLGLNKVTAGAYGDHEASLALFQGLGFSVEGRFRSHLYREGSYHEKVLMGLLREEYLRRRAMRVASQAPAERAAQEPTGKVHA